MQPTTSQDALAQLQATQGGAKSAADILANARTQQGVQQAQDTVAGLRGAITNTTRLLNQVAPSVMGRTATSLVNNAQATRQIANEQQPIAQNLSQQTSDYTTATGDLGRANEAATAAANAEYGDQQSKLSYLQNLYNSLYGREQDAAQLAEKQREFDASLAAQRTAAANSGLGGLFSGGGSKSAPVASGSTPTNPVQQSAYNDALTRVTRDDDAALVSDYKATLASANYGNPKDQFKIKVYQQLRPDLFLPIGSQWNRYFGTQPTPPQGPPNNVVTKMTAGLPSALTRGF